MVVGETGLAALAPALRKAEAAMNRTVNVTVYRPSEFDQKVRDRNHFLRRVLGGPKLMVIGEFATLEATGR